MGVNGEMSGMRHPEELLQSNQRGVGQAVVIGGSIAGLLGARALSEHFQKVIILEREQLPEGPEPRKSAPQGRHIHAVLEAGLNVIDDFFPGLLEEMQRDGVDLIDQSRDVAWYHCGAWKPRFESGFRSILCSRPYLEWKIRQHVTALPNVELRQGQAVEELVMDSSRSRVTGVKVKGPEGHQTLEADLLVDSSGRGTRTPQWLEELGYGRPAEEQIGIDMAYTSRLYERPAGFNEWKALALYARAPDSCRSGYIANIEGGRWIVTLNGYFGEHPPTDDAGFLEFARSLPTPHIHEYIRDAKPLTQLVTHKLASSRWLHYERLPRFPEGLVVLGDSVCAFNPIYGQGMTVAALGAKLLRDCVAERKGASELTGLSRHFQKKLARVVGFCWFLATTMDLRYPKTQGKRMPGLKLLQWSVGNAIDMTSLDVEGCRQFLKVLHLRSGLEALLQPRFTAALLAYNIKSLFVPLEQRANVDTLPAAPGQQPPAEDKQPRAAA
jgi:2-polyprenyl-6-methoxyphenol hydroxylase-like FAD-dependent oxidoreductase